MVNEVQGSIEPMESIAEGDGPTAEQEKKFMSRIAVSRS